MEATVQNSYQSRFKILISSVRRRGRRRAPPRGVRRAPIGRLYRARQRLSDLHRPPQPPPRVQGGRGMHASREAISPLSPYARGGHGGAAVVIPHEWSTVKNHRQVSTQSTLDCTSSDASLGVTIHPLHPISAATAIIVRSHVTHMLAEYFGLRSQCNGRRDRRVPWSLPKSSRQNSLTIFVLL